MRDWEARATDRADYVGERWPKRATGYGIACGPSGLYVVDCDIPKPDTPPPPTELGDVANGYEALVLLAAEHGEPMPDRGTFTVRTGRGGTHLYYQMPADHQLGNTASALGWLVDTRGHGGYVVGPGSTVDGRTYDVSDDTPPAPLPGWILRLLLDRRQTASQGGAGVEVAPSAVRLSGATVGPQWAGAALAGECERIRAAPVGSGNHAVNAAAYAVGRLVGGGLIDRAVAARDLLAALDTWQFAAPGDRARMERTLRSAMDAGERVPRVPTPRERRHRAA